MASLRKVMEAVLTGRSDANIRFDSIRRLLRSMGFDERVRGDHHIFTLEGAEEILNLQPLRGGQAKPYQVKQVREIITRYRLSIRR